MFYFWFRCSFPDAICSLDAEHKLSLYGVFHLIALGVYGTGPVLTAWLVNNSEPYYRRATIVALGAIAANAVCLCVAGVFILPLLIPYFSGKYLGYLELPNQRWTKVQENIRAKLLQDVVDEKECKGGRSRAWVELGDRHPDFVYTLQIFWLTRQVEYRREYKKWKPSFVRFQCAWMTGNYLII